jgi:hypothetical protein
MGRLDEFIAQQVQPQLAAGEVITGTGVVHRPLKFNLMLIPSHYDVYFIAVTTSRLFLIKTEASLMGIFSAPKEYNHGVAWVGLDEINVVELGTVGGVGGGRTLTLRFLPGNGASLSERGGVRYDLYPTATKLDGQPRLYEQFGSWLQAQVSAGAFPRRPEVEARAQAAMQAQAQEEARRRERAEIQARRRAELVASASRLLGHFGKSAIALASSPQFKRWFVRLALPALPLIFTIFSLIQMGDAFSSASSSEAHIRLAPNATSRAFWQGQLTEANTAIWLHSAASVVGGFVSLIAIGAGFLLTRRRPAPLGTAHIASPQGPSWGTPHNALPPPRAAWGTPPNAPPPPRAAWGTPSASPAPGHAWGASPPASPLALGRGAGGEGPAWQPPAA